jgi:hypothetical protein
VGDRRPCSGEQSVQRANRAIVVRCASTRASSSGRWRCASDMISTPQGPGNRTVAGPAEAFDVERSCAAQHPVRNGVVEQIGGLRCGASLSSTTNTCRRGSRPDRPRCRARAPDARCLERTVVLPAGVDQELRDRISRVERTMNHHTVVEERADGQRSASGRTHAVSSPTSTSSWLGGSARSSTTNKRFRRRRGSVITTACDVEPPQCGSAVLTPFNRCC